LDLPIVVPSASCAGMLRVHYRELFAGTPDQARAEALSRRVYELTEFLVWVLDLKLDDLGPPVRVALHNSCSARREMGVAGATVALLGRLAQVDLLEPDRATECCGFGGTFAVKQPEISAAMTGDKADAIASLDVSILQNNLLGPLLGIRDPRTDKRIDFVGGIRGTGELERKVDNGHFAVAFSFRATTIAQLFAVADAGKIMPPKSTWFEPKLKDGLVSHLLD